MPLAKENDRQKAILDQARQLYRDGKFKAALATFKEAFLRCPCTRDVMVQAKKLGLSLQEIPIPLCHCKEFDSLSPLNPDKLAIYKTAKKSCICGSGLCHCNAPRHILALEGMIATYEKLEAFGKARQYAALLIIIAPSAPEGYLRLAKALRLCDSEKKSGITMARCQWIHRQGIESVRTFGNKDHTKLKVLLRLISKDIIGMMPPELRAMVFENLEYLDLCRCMRVCKAWKRACLDAKLWSHLKFVKKWPGSTSRPFRKGVFNHIISNRAKGMAKGLTVSGLRDFRIGLPILTATLRVLQQLEFLSLRGVNSAHESDLEDHSVPSCSSWFKAVFEKAPPGLKTLHLAAFSSGREPLPWPATSMIPMAQSLEELSLSHLSNISGVPGVLYTTTWPKLTKLKMLSTVASRRTRGLSIDFANLVQATPSLKDLSLRSLDPVPGHSTPWWRNLERLELEVHAPSRSGDPNMLLPRLSPSIRSLDIPDGAFSFLSLYLSKAMAYPRYCDREGVLPFVALERLEHLHLRDGNVPYQRDDAFREVLAWFLQLIEPSISNGILTSLAVPFCTKSRQELDKVLNKAAIRTLSCFDFLDRYPAHQCGDYFVEWLAEFPNLTTVGVFPQKFDGAWMLIMKVLEMNGKIDTIYTNILHGVFRDGVLERAQARGVKIIEASRVPEPILQPLG